MFDVIKNILFNYWFPLVASVVGFILFTYIYNYFDFWYYLGISLLSGCGVSCIVYFIIKIRKK